LPMHDRNSLEPYLINSLEPYLINSLERYKQP
jgi:hypothetical protein